MSAEHVKQEEWFHGILPREEIVNLIKHDGDYLLRESTDAESGSSQLILSVMWSGPKHFIIQGNEQSGWQLTEKTFRSIQELINHYQQSSLPITKNTSAILKKAILRPDWMLGNDDIGLGERIGSGKFGDVFKGKYKGEEVAVKICNDKLSDDHKKKFFREGCILKSHNHPNIVRFIGIAAQRQPLLIVMEYLIGGSLLNYLKAEGKKKPRALNNKQLTNICLDIAGAMVYLDEQQCIHRDLAARNCLIGNDNVVKICDFGLSIQQDDHKVPLLHIPVKWTAPEAVKYGMYTTASDVWSFGVLMWEVFSFGQAPYEGLSKEQALENLLKGFRLLPPEGTPKSIYDLMLKCWEGDPTYRPRFQQIFRELESLKIIV